jgi:GNAT superfamily N-acetyltransferase
MPQLRTAVHADIPALQALIARSGRALSVGYYTPVQAEAITVHVFGVDTQLIDDRTYFAVEDGNRIVACGGWSKRRTLFGGDQTKQGADPLLDAATESARIRAFFVDPAHARRGLAQTILEACLDAARGAGFSSIELAATLPGEPFYLRFGFAAIERFEITLPGDIHVPLVRMQRAIA